MSGSIHNNRTPIVSHNSLDHMNNLLTKPHSSKNQTSEGLGHPIIRFGHVQLNDHISPNVWLLNVMIDFLCKRDVLYDASSSNKLGLITSDETMEDRSKFEANELGDNLI
ncbi:hypothetical protein HAX54_038676, partial [Datura stramonium]|nr:hypothetical protein [Datura stramonium]